MHKKITLLLITFLLFSSVSIAATIRGSIYDVNLDKVRGVIVEVNSSPNQRIASIDGTYSFNLPKGAYTITAIYNDQKNPQKSIDKIYINEEGEYVFDIFLFPENSTEKGVFNSSGINVNGKSNLSYYPYYVLLLLVFLILVFLITYFLFFRKKRIEQKILKKDDKDLEKIVLIVKKHGGRATQKDIRKEIPLSEAKISLMIAELESEGKVRKIKRGRGNIIVLQ